MSEQTAPRVHPEAVPREAFESDRTDSETAGPAGAGGLAGTHPTENYPRRDIAGESDPKGGDSNPKSEIASQPLPNQLNLSSAWAPLAIPAYRSFWIAGLVSNFGTWMHETGAVWLMTSLEPRPEMVAAVRTCMTIPVFCLALPAGVWADRFDRKKWLISTQLVLFCIATSMALLAGMQLISPTILLLLTAAMGVGMILNLPAWQATTPELVPPALVPSAVSVGSISFNLARSLGPALAGLIIAQLGIWVTFAFNAVSFLAVVLVISRWQPQPERRPKKPPNFFDELRKGVFVVSNSREIRNTLIRILLYAIPASILWSLLSLVATEKLLYQERGFGLCLGLIGTGAVVGAWFLPRLRLSFTSESIVLSTQIVYAVICVAIGLGNSKWVILPGLLMIGTCWMATMTTLNATAQVYLPRKFRARGMATFIMSFSLGMACGSVTWGWIGYGFGINSAFIVSGAAMLVVAATTYPLKIGTLRPISRG